MFRAASGDDNITVRKSIESPVPVYGNNDFADSKYDQYRKRASLFTQGRIRRFLIISAECASCHSGELFTDESYRNTGMYYNAQFDDKGRYRVTPNIADYMKFRVPVSEYRIHGTLYARRQILFAGKWCF